MSTELITEALASLETDKRRRIWVVRNCPYCGQRHAHNAGTTDNPYAYLGEINAHCISPIVKTYMLKDINSD